MPAEATAAVDTTQAAPPPPAAKETPEQAFRRIEASLGGPDDDGGGETPAEGEEPAAPAAPAKGKDAKGDKAAADAAKKTEPEKEGEGVPVPAERAKFREEKRTWRDKTRAWEEDFQKRVGEAQTSLAKEREATQSLVRAKELLARGDLDGFAEAIGYEKGWNDLQTEALAQIQSPMYRELRDLKRKDEARERDQKAAEERARQQAQQQQRQERERQYVADLGVGLTKDPDPLVAAATKEVGPMFVQLTYAELVRHHRAEGEEMEHGDAARAALRTLYSNARKIVDFVDGHSETSDFAKTIGRRGAAIPESGDRSTDTSVRRGSAQAPPKHVSHTRAGEASGSRPLSEAELKRKYIREMNRAHAEEAEAG